MIWREGPPVAPSDVCALIVPLEVTPSLAVWTLETPGGRMAVALPETWEPPGRVHRARAIGPASISLPREAQPVIGTAGLRSWTKGLARQIFLGLQVAGRVVDSESSAERLWGRLDDDTRRTWTAWVVELPGVRELRAAALGVLANDQRWLWLAVATSPDPARALRAALGGLHDAVVVAAPGADRSWQAAVLDFCATEWGGGGWRTAVVEAPRRWFVEGAGAARPARPWEPDHADARGAGLWVGPWLRVGEEVVPASGHLAGWLCGRPLSGRASRDARIRGLDGTECEVEKGDWGPLVTIWASDGAARVLGDATTAGEPGWWGVLEAARTARALARRVVHALESLADPPTAEVGRARAIEVALAVARDLWTDGVLSGRAFSEAASVRSARWDWPDEEVLAERYLLDIEVSVKDTELPVRMRIIAGRGARPKLDFS